jgi:L-alanine-DL-glutamate epimerase-like enolase superfamily enzyme
LELLVPPALSVGGVRGPFFLTAGNADMSRPTDIRVLDVRPTVERLAFRAPLKFGGRVMDSTTLVHVEIDVENRRGARSIGRGSMPMGNVWAWPSAALDPDATLAAMLGFGERVADLTRGLSGFEHPLEHGLALNAELKRAAASFAADRKLADPIPVLAALVVASPFDAALHDGFGMAAGISAFHGLSEEHLERDLGSILGPEFAGERLDRYVLREPQPTMPLYHLVGALDPLTAADVASPIRDGLPETLSEWIPFNGLTHLKIKLAGDQLDWDVQRVLAIEAVAAEAQAKRGASRWCYSLDFNEKCASVEYVLEFLERVQAGSASAYDRVQYIEQPTRRDLAKEPRIAVHAAARLKPVVIDESLVDLESLRLARELGYSGVALKACKGHTESLLMGAAAIKSGSFLCVQDLTCPGASFLHSASLAARIPTVAAIEGNGRQYCPAGNRGWEDRFPAMFRIDDGTVGTGVLDGPGLGF